MRKMLVLLVLAGCAHEIEGPELSVEEETVAVCGNQEATVRLRGSGLSPMVVDGATDDPKVKLPEVCLVRDGAEPVCIPEEDVTWVSQNEIELTVRPDLMLEPGDYEVIVTNPDGTEARGRATLRVVGEGPILFWVDPPVVYSGIATQVTLFGANLGDDIEEVGIRAEDGTETTLDFRVEGDRANKLSAIVPAGTAAGTYDVFVTNAEGCITELPDGLTVTDSLTLEVSGIDPSFGWSERATPVTISGSGFVSLPRAYLNPATPSADTVASALASVAFVGASRLTAVVPEGLPVDTYDLIVVNPDGAVGLVEDAFLVTADPPPEVDNVSPSFLDNDTDKMVTIDGASFRDPSVSITCRLPDGTTMTLDGTVSDATADSIAATLPVRGLPAGTVCVLRVTNSDGSYEDYSAIGISNPASNIAPFEEGTELTTARRALALATGRATRAARFLHAIGGDDGTTAGALATVESSPVDIFGEPGEWFEQPVRLPAPRTMAGAVTIGRFLYLVGGNDGSGSTGAVSRAEVLDPLDAPEITDVGARQGMGDGLGAGVWYYRVSAVMADDDPNNPGGETLPSDAVALNLPDSLADTVVITLYWDPVPGAKGYRVYRSPEPDQPVGATRLVAEIDDGATTSYEEVSGTADGPPPLPLGATGVWMDMPELGAAREGPGVALAQDPADALTWHVYALGGRDAGAELDSWERLTVTVEADGTHAVGTWTTGATALSAPRAELGAWSVSHEDAIGVPVGTTYVYAGGGDGSSNVEVAEVQEGGDLSAWTLVDAMSPPRSGYAAVAGADFLFAFGGQGGGPSDGGVSAEIDPPPDLVNWNNEGERMTVPRHLCGGVIESAFIYVVGGQTTGGPTTSTERTVL